MNESHCRVRIVGGHEAHEHESLIGRRRYWCPGGEPPPLDLTSKPYDPVAAKVSSLRDLKARKA